MRRSTGSSASLTCVGEHQQQPHHHHRRSGNFGPGELQGPSEAMCCSRSSSPGSPCGYAGIGSVTGTGFAGSGSGDLLSPSRLHQPDGRSMFWNDMTTAPRSPTATGDVSPRVPAPTSTAIRAVTSPSTPAGSPMSTSVHRQIVTTAPSPSSTTRSPSESSPSEYDDASSIGKSSTNSGDNLLCGGMGGRPSNCCGRQHHHQHHHHYQQQQQRRPEKFNRGWIAPLSSAADIEYGDNFDGDEDDDYDDISPS